METASVPSPLDPTPPYHYDRLVRVTEADIDINHHVNNVVYVRWVQDVAIAHWEEAVPSDIAVGHVWVVMRHEIDYKKPALLGDLLRVRTWVRAMSALVSERRCQIFRDADGTLLMDACTQWCAVKPENGRPRRMDPRIPPRFGLQNPS
jgi:acyl-CoA thioester hydrolase